jgi:hypothetical protein
MIDMSRSEVARFIELSPARHCEEQSDEAILWGGNEIAEPRHVGARNDRMCLIDQTTTKMPRIEQEIKTR